MLDAGYLGRKSLVFQCPGTGIQYQLLLRWSFAKLIVGDRAQKAMKSRISVDNDIFLTIR